MVEGISYVNMVKGKAGIIFYCSVEIGMYRGR